MHHVRTPIIAMLAAALLGGCVAPGTYPSGTYYTQAQAVAGLSIGELLQMLQAGRPQADIAADVASQGLRTSPAPADLDVLAAAGAAPELLAAIRSAPIVAPAPPALVVAEPYPPWSWYNPWYYPWGGYYGLGLGMQWPYWGFGWSGGAYPHPLPPGGGGGAHPGGPPRPAGPGQPGRPAMPPPGGAAPPARPAAPAPSLKPIPAPRVIPGK